MEIGDLRHVKHPPTIEDCPGVRKELELD